jgi:hypothetical protein
LFSEELKKNFLKIVTNVYYLNTFKTFKELEENNFREKNVDGIYKKFLKTTRREIYKFFNIPKVYDNFKTKYLIRLYVYSLNVDDNVRTEYFRYAELINKILKNLSDKKMPTGFIKLKETKIENVIYIILNFFINLFLENCRS